MADVAPSATPTSRPGWRLRAAACAVLPLVCASAAPPSRATTDEQRFNAENSAAMTRMMSAMTIRNTGDVDRDFVLMMVPHHQGAIDMAVAELRYGRNETLRRIAQEIMVTQAQEIKAMHAALEGARTERP